jgi:uncharacterized protein YeeX (DUF496 family)
MEVNDTTNEGVSVLTVKITKKGSDKLIDLLQDSLGYIEENLHEQIINDIQTWMNENYNELIEFYIRSVEKGLVPSDQFIGVVEENKALHERIKELETAMSTPVETPKVEPPEEREPFKDISKMNGWELRKLAKKIGLPITTGMTKDMIYEMVRDAIKETGKK